LRGPFHLATLNLKMRNFKLSGRTSATFNVVFVALFNFNPREIQNIGPTFANPFKTLAKINLNSHMSRMTFDHDDILTGSHWTP
jgi:hypothetical protein